MKFSERHGYVEPRTALQVEGMDLALRNGLWNCLCAVHWNEVKDDYIDYWDSETRSLVRKAWAMFFKRRIDDLSEYWSTVQSSLKDWFFKATWYEVYDFLEFCAVSGMKSRNDSLMSVANLTLEREKAGYRFIESQITPITSEIEITSIEDSVGGTDSRSPVAIHMNRALKLLADRSKPDFANSVKESISAVEACCQEITGDNKAMLSTALKKIEAEHGIHPAFRSACEKLYGYTSDAKGIRHARNDDSDVTF